MAADALVREGAAQRAAWGQVPIEWKLGVYMWGRRGREQTLKAGSMEFNQPNQRGHPGLWSCLALSPGRWGLAQESYATPRQKHTDFGALHGLEWLPPVTSCELSRIRHAWLYQFCSVQWNLHSLAAVEALGNTEGCHFRQQLLKATQCRLDFNLKWLHFNNRQFLYQSTVQEVQSNLNHKTIWILPF